MRIITWNVNSVRARHDRLLALLARHAPDVVCLQELKLEDERFPREELRAAGYHAAVHGQRTYNGVAILSRTPIEDVRVGMGDDVDDPQARLVGGTIAGVRVWSAYFPNGSTPSSDKYRYKLEWMRRLREKLDREESSTRPLVLAGDFNVFPEDRDAKNPGRWRDTVLSTPEVRAALREIRAFGLFDSLRVVSDAADVFSWWDYRMLGFQKDDGLRIDHLDVTPPLRHLIRGVWVDRDEREGEQPSDHAPVVLDLGD